MENVHKTCKARFLTVSKYHAANELLVATWIRFQQFGTLFDREGDYWAVMKLEETCRHDPHEALETILEILQRNQSSIVVEALVSGPMQDLLAHHGEAIREHIEQVAGDNPLFASLLHGREP